MLMLRGIDKEYRNEGKKIKALDHVNIEFKENEFVTILGPQGSGKTTLLNIIGGLERYSSGDLSINRKSTKTFSDKDWDFYRSTRVGIIFQNYSLLPGRTLLANIEIALILSGAAGSGRRERASAALHSVGLEGQLFCKPEQLSASQLQRAAIARALVNDPDILLADEPAAALDPQSCEQIMSIFKSLAKDKLVIMATGNPDLAHKYSSRIVELSDGAVTGDSCPYHVVVEKPVRHKKEKKKRAWRRKKSSISFFAAAALSISTLAANKARTAAACLAGSIGVTAAAFSAMMGKSRMISAFAAVVIAAVSLTASCTFISAILYTSVFRRSREIRILRSIGGSRRDVCRIAAGETCSIGFLAGCTGIGGTLILTNPVNAVIAANMTDAVNVKLTAAGGLVLVMTSMALNYFLGFICSGISGKKEPAAVNRTG